MATTHVTRRIHAPRSKVYAALIDANAVAKWMVPDGMTSQVHAFEGRENGRFRISLSYDAATGDDAASGNAPTGKSATSRIPTGKTSGHTDTYHGRFAELVPDQRVVEVMEFETEDPALRGEMRVTITLSDVDGGTELVAVHDQLPSGVPLADNDRGWQLSLAKLAALVEDPAASS
jgi:uncharacterized protein YndB with AHSA1/START domain